LRLTASLLTAILIVVPARAQPVLESVDSIEWMAVDSSVVVRGTIVAHKSEEEPQGLVWHTVTFRVDETLKGRHRPTIQFVVATNTIEKQLPTWKQTGRPVLAFLEESRYVVSRTRLRRFARFPLSPRKGWSKGSFVELDPDVRPGAYTLDLKPITRTDEILRATREAVAAPPAPAKLCSYWFDLPHAVGWTRLSVPIDARLEAKALQWIRSDDKDVRREGASALVLFPSDANAAILMGLLDDPASWDFVIHEGAREREERVYSVREEATSVLKAWGYEVPRRVLREPIPADGKRAPPGR
jgi:hypothetical protein